MSQKPTKLFVDEEKNKNTRNRKIQEESKDDIIKNIKK